MARNAEPAHLPCEKSHRIARLDMCFARKKKPILEAAFECWFKPGDPRRIETLVTVRQRGEALEVGAIAGTRHNQSPGRDGAGIMLLP